MALSCEPSLSANVLHSQGWSSRWSQPRRDSNAGHVCGPFQALELAHAQQDLGTAADQYLHQSCGSIVAMVATIVQSNHQPPTRATHHNQTHQWIGLTRTANSTAAVHRNSVQSRNWSLANKVHGFNAAARYKPNNSTRTQAKAKGLCSATEGFAPCNSVVRTDS